MQACLCPLANSVAVGAALGLMHMPVFLTRNPSVRMRQGISPIVPATTSKLSPYLLSLD